MVSPCSNGRMRVRAINSERCASGKLRNNRHSERIRRGSLPKLEFRLLLTDTSPAGIRLPPTSSEWRRPDQRYPDQIRPGLQPSWLILSFQLCHY
jgi:uncharacterized protein (DUF2126 family)